MSDLIWKDERPKEKGLSRLRKKGAHEFAPVRLQETAEGFLVTSQVERPPALWLAHPAFGEYEWSGPLEIPKSGTYVGQGWFCRSTETWQRWTGHWWVEVRPITA